MDETHALNSMARNATLHCLVGCTVGEVIGMVIGTTFGLGNAVTILLATGLAFIFGYSLSTLPLLRVGVGITAAFTVVLAADTLSIATMEVVDNIVMAIIPGAMNAGLVNPIFWLSMPVAIAAAYFAAYPVNRYLLTKNKGHALVMKYHTGHDHDVHANHNDH